MNLRQTARTGLLLPVLLILGAASMTLAQEPRTTAQSIAAAREELRRNRPQAAIQLLETARKQSPSDVDVRIELSKAYVFDRQYGRAEETLRSVLRDASANRTAKLELARVLSYEGKYQDSDRLFRELLARDSHDEAASLGLVRNLVLEGKREEAKREARMALALHPNSLRLQEYQDMLDRKEPAGETRRGRIYADVGYFSDTAGHRSWLSAQSFDARLMPYLTNTLRLDERSVWNSQGPKANVFSVTDALRVKPRPWLWISGGGGTVRFADGSSRALCRGDVTLHPLKNLWWQGGFSRNPVVPTFDAAQFDLLAEGWWSRADWQPGNWRLTADFFKQHYSDSNRTQREDVEILRWLGNAHFAFGVGYDYSHVSFSQAPLHGYFSPAQYHSHLAVSGFRLGVGKFFRAEYLGRYGGESVSQNPYEVAWEVAARNRVILGEFSLGADYSYFRLVQSTGAFSAQMGRVSLSYRF